MPEFDFDVLIIGAGAAGVGVGRIFKELGLSRFTLLERHEIGATFRRWPREMRFISPSFTSNAYGLLDLNAVALDTSPAFSLADEHPSGRSFARYLEGVVEEFSIPVTTGVEVTSIETLETPAGFCVRTTQGALTSRFVVWAAGEFQYPRLTPFPGGQLCRHNSTVSSWRALEGDEFLILGGSESGIDAATRLCSYGKRVRVVDRGEPWDEEGSDPSATLSPITLRRLDRALATERLELIGKETVDRVTQRAGKYCVTMASGLELSSPTPPILCTGFAGSLMLIGDKFEWNDDGVPSLSEIDESTKTPGLFVTGPLVRHEQLVLCFIYKFRQRFAVVADAIAERLGLDRTPLERYRLQRMFLDDLSCCEETCAC